VGSLAIIPLDNHCWVCWWKNSENWSIFSKVKGKSSVLFFLTQGVYSYFQFVFTTDFPHITFHIRLGPPESSKEPFGVASASFFTGWMPFVSSN